MALKIVLAGIVGGVLHMIWGLVYWFAVPIDDFVKRVPAEHEVLEILSDALPGPGVYFLPYPLDLSSEAGLLHRELSLPRVSIFFGSGQADPLTPVVFATGLANAIAIAGMTAVILAVAGAERQRFARRFLAAALVGVVGAYAIESLYVIWYHHPLYFHLRMLLFEAIGASIAAIPIAWIVRTAEPA